MRKRTGWPGGRGVPTRVAAAAMLAVLVSLVLVAAGCGDDDSDTQGNDEYASSVCTAIGNWQQQITSIATGLSRGISKISLQAAVTQAGNVTKTLTTEIAAVPPPDTPDGQAAKEQVDQLSTDLTAAVDSAKSTAAQVPGDASTATLAAALAGLAPQLKTLGTTVRSTLISLQNAGGSLASAFKDADSCQSLGG